MADWQENDPLAPIQKETHLSNQVLHDYALLGPGRSFAKLLVEYLKRDIPPTRSAQTLVRWSVRYQWQARVAAWDRLQLQKELAAFEQERIEDRKRRIAILRAYRAKTMEAMQTLEPNLAEWKDVTAALHMITTDLRAEYGEDIMRMRMIGEKDDPAALHVLQITDPEKLQQMRTLREQVEQSATMATESPPSEA